MLANDVGRPVEHYAVPYRDQSVETLFLDGPHEALRVDHHIGRAFWNEREADPRLAEFTLHGAAPFPIPIADQTASPCVAPSSAMAEASA
jgi:hypothetical protein